MDDIPPEFDLDPFSGLESDTYEETSFQSQENNEPERQELKDDLQQWSSEASSEEAVVSEEKQDDTEDLKEKLTKALEGDKDIAKLAMDFIEGKTNLIFESEGQFFLAYPEAFGDSAGKKARLLGETGIVVSVPDKPMLFIHAINDRKACLLNQKASALLKEASRAGPVKKDSNIEKKATPEQSEKPVQRTNKKESRAAPSGQDPFGSLDFMDGRGSTPNIIDIDQAKAIYSEFISGRLKESKGKAARFTNKEYRQFMLDKGVAPKLISKLINEDASVFKEKANEYVLASQS